MAARTPSAEHPVTVIVPLPPSYRGGTEEYAYRVAGRVHAAMPVEILTTRVRLGHDAHPLPTGTIPITYLEGREIFQRPVVTGAGLRSVRAQVARSALVHLHMPFPRVEARVARWCEEAGIPLVLTYHMDADFAGASGLPGAGLVTALYRRLSAYPALRRTRVVVSNSGGYARVSPVLSQFPTKVRVIYKGVDVERLGLTPGDRSAPARPPPDPALFPGTPASTKRVVFVGRLVPYKGLPVLLEAIARLARQGLEVKLFLAGKGPQRAELERTTRALGLADRVVFLGFVPDERLHDLYTGADVVACPSIGLMESTATCLEEAAACGVPVLGSSLSGSEETVPSDGVHGILVPPRDAGAVAEGLRRLLEAPRPADRPPFRTWEDTAREYLALYRELLGAPAG